ncbi:sulfatase/phosphatase domain-containing protein [Pasteurella multocida]|uniref:sulfatase/phosphatase domain-containing protein n=1 Tax=Pasteurella multocida TaxID=747 RepID=UPI0021003F4F|nr:sulfatase/phosphatase domain-containing protein [Pasteurella multocida]MDY0488576.1 DUF4976 domain-containing protein [Pasteurella multocida]MDY0595178.1 DUF4976 domain-containing protein [Pasteurella multocida]MDY0632182.1 DUF4976 domain-containing protein [Pasteurella multocida]MDY0664579.1 DUF4976 domain-containing protein [Pasteurella multocida]MDY0666612.1 DUF4976 domain-containing protein [Pasteurella multocida]
MTVKHGGVHAGSDVYQEDFLYDLEKDPYELNNLVRDPAYEQVRVELREKLCEHMLKAKEERPTILPAA